MEADGVSTDHGMYRIEREQRKPIPGYCSSVCDPDAICHRVRSQCCLEERTKAEWRAAIQA